MNNLPVVRSPWRIVILLLGFVIWFSNRKQTQAAEVY